MPPDRRVRCGPGRPVSTWTALLVFAGIPAVVFGLIFVVVVLTEGRERPYDPRIVGIVRPEVGCTVRTDQEGRQRHEPVPEAGPTCFIARCAECHTIHRDGPDDVHFADLREGIDTVRALDWQLAGPRLRCPRCR
ncbi:hypothetical protein GCM10010210_46430 [Pseudonocardia hydrocarbonoxydans]